MRRSLKPTQGNVRATNAESTTTPLFMKVVDVKLMKYIPHGEIGLPTVELTRRNLNALLAKLDGNPPDSECTLVDPTDKIAVKAVEDSVHYANRRPGPLHEDTESVIIST